MDRRHFLLFQHYMLVTKKRVWLHITEQRRKINHSVAASAQPERNIKHSTEKWWFRTCDGLHKNNPKCFIQASDSNWQVTVRTSQNCYIEVHSDVITWHFVLWISSTQTHRSVQRHLPQSISSHHPWYLHIYKFTKLNTESSNKIMSGSDALFWLSGWRKFFYFPTKKRICPKDAHTKDNIVSLLC